jgi:hypothetical protein
VLILRTVLLLAQVRGITSMPAKTYDALSLLKKSPVKRQNRLVHIGPHLVRYGPNENSDVVIMDIAYNGLEVPVTVYTFYNTISLVRPTSLSRTPTFRRVGGAYTDFWERRRSFQKVELPSSLDASRRIEASRN